VPGPAAIKPQHALLAVGLAFAVIGHLGDGTASRELAFWLGVLLSFVGLGWQLRDERLR
jgi:hypothetical protein